MGRHGPRRPAGAQWRRQAGRGQGRGAPERSAVARPLGAGGSRRCGPAPGPDPTGAVRRVASLVGRAGGDGHRFPVRQVVASSAVARTRRRRGSQARRPERHGVRGRAPGDAERRRHRDTYVAVLHARRLAAGNPDRGVLPERARGFRLTAAARVRGVQRLSHHVPREERRRGESGIARVIGASLGTPGPEGFSESGVHRSTGFASCWPRRTSHSLAGQTCDRRPAQRRRPQPNRSGPSSHSNLGSCSPRTSSHTENGTKAGSSWSMSGLDAHEMRAEDYESQARRSASRSRVPLPEKPWTGDR